MPWPFVTLILVLLATAALLAGVFTLLMARMLLRPTRMSDGRAAYLLQRLSPGDLGMPYEPLRFTVRDQQTGRPVGLAAWWIPRPAPCDRTVVLIHGYADAKIGAIAWAPTWQSLGFNILAIDLRAHGESDGMNSTAGFFERYDLDQLLDQLLARHPREARMIVLFGVSLGAAVALGCAELRDSRDIDAIILECPFGDFTHAAVQHGKRMNMPAPTLQRAGIKLAEWLGGARFDDVRPVDLIPKVKCPLMLIEGGQDEFVSDEDKQALREAMNRREGLNSVYFRVESAGHVLGIIDDPEAYRRRIAEFLADVPFCAEPDTNMLESPTIGGTS